MTLSILICTIPKRKHFLSRLLKQLLRQTGAIIDRHDLIRYLSHNCEILIDPADNDSIGKKRNRLLSAATGDYTCFIDDDDRIAKNYIELIMDAIKTEPDCVSLRGIMTTDGRNPELFEHSIRYDTWQTLNAKQGEVKYLRNPNHLNTIKADIAKQITFPEVNWGEDRSFSDKLKESGLLKTEAHIDQVIYYYDFRTAK